MKITFPARLSWENFHTVMLKGLKVYAFYLAVLSLFRLFFIVYLHDYLGPASGTSDILLALWRGSRLSMQTAGCLALLSFLPSLCLHYLWPRAERWSWRVMNFIVLAVLAVLYAASFPFYRQFRMNFNQMLFTGANDDIYALFIPMIQQYWLPVRLAGALLLAYGLAALDACGDAAADCLPGHACTLAGASGLPRGHISGRTVGHLWRQPWLADSCRLGKCWCHEG